MDMKVGPGAGFRENPADVCRYTAMKTLTCVFQDEVSHFLTCGKPWMLKRDQFSETFKSAAETSRVSSSSGWVLSNQTTSKYVNHLDLFMATC
jgi:hypothetical protein